MNRVHIKTYGCQMNERDSEAVAAMLRARGYRIVAERGRVRRAAPEHLQRPRCRGAEGDRQGGELPSPGSGRIRTSSWASWAAWRRTAALSLLDRLPDVDLIVGTQKFHRVPDYLDNLRAARAAGVRSRRAEETGSPRSGTTSPRRSFDTIQQEAGLLASSRNTIRPDHRQLEKGAREITLLGQIVTSYGRRDPAHRGAISPFVRLLEAIHAIDGLERIRFTSPHPRGFKQDLVEAYGRLPKLCEYVHLPLQSGSDRILKAMNRPYSRGRYLEIVRALRTVRPEMYFSTDIIVGFPGETDEDFADTRSLFEAVNYDMAFVFKYSIRTGTPAATMPQVPAAVKEERNRELLALLRQNSWRRNQALLGTAQEVLIEGGDKTGRRFTGRTRGNRVAVFDAAPRLVGTLAPVKITRVSVSTLYGELDTVS
jgi:tRNA-2-methylthio-N6-dimethylallyladenosine synthase